MLSGLAIKPEKVEAGTGFYEKWSIGTKVRPQMATIVAKRTDTGARWASAPWQYLEDVNRKNYVPPRSGAAKASATTCRAQAECSRKD